MDILLVISSLASALAAVLAWTAKLWWGKEYSAAKNETIKAKDAQIELLQREVQNYRELTPMKIREYFLSVKEQLEEYNNALKAELDEKEATIERMRADDDLHNNVIEELKAEKEDLRIRLNAIRNQIEGFDREMDSIEVYLATPIDALVQKYGRVSRRPAKAPTGNGKTDAALKLALGEPGATSEDEDN